MNIGHRFLPAPFAGLPFRFFPAFLICTIAVALWAMPGTAQGQIFETNYNNNTLDEFNLDGTPVGSGTLVSSGLHQPSGLVISGDDLFVTNETVGGIGSIGEYTTSGAPVGTGTLVTGLSYPAGLAISGSDLFVVNTGNASVGEYTTSGSTVNASLISSLVNPWAIAISGNDLFIASDSGPNNGTVKEYTTSGAFVATVLTHLDYVYAIAISGSDLFVDNTAAGQIGSGSIGEYTLSGSTVNASLITGLNQFLTPGIAVFGSDLFVGDNNGNAGSQSAISEFTTTGGTLNLSLVTTNQISPSAIVVVPEPRAWAFLATSAGLFLVFRAGRGNRMLRRWLAPNRRACRIPGRNSG